MYFRHLSSQAISSMMRVVNTEHRSVGMHMQTHEEDKTRPTAELDSTWEWAFVAKLFLSLRQRAYTRRFVC